MFGLTTQRRYDKMYNKLTGDINFITNYSQELALKNTELRKENIKLKSQIKQFRIFVEKLSRYDKMVFSLDHKLSLYTIYYINGQELK